MNLLFGWLTKGSMQVSLLDHIIMVMEFMVVGYSVWVITIYNKIRNKRKNRRD